MLAKGDLMKRVFRLSEVLHEASGQLSELQDTVYEASRDLDAIYNLLRVNDVQQTLGESDAKD